MRFYRLFNHSEAAPASGLLFLRRDDAERYRDILLWPYAKSGFWPLAAGGEMPLDAVELAAESVYLDACVAPALGAVVTQRGGVLGWAPLLTGDCFDPEQWAACTPEELAHPERRTAWESAARSLKGEHRT